MRIDGRKIRDSLQEELRREASLFGKPVCLAVVSVGDDAVVRSFIKIKKQFSEYIGVTFLEENLPSSVSPARIKDTIEKLNHDPLVTGIIVQLPLPRQIDTDDILNCISWKKDVDVLSQKANEIFNSGTSALMPPVPAAVAEILQREHIEIGNHTKVVVLGSGKLVGAPVATWFRRQHIDVTVIDRPHPDLASVTRDADIIVLGTGVAGILKKEMVKSGAVVIDAGTSESGGVIVGDADPRCEEVTNVFTPVPGGVGPITVAMIFKNLMLFVGTDE